MDSDLDQLRSLPYISWVEGEIDESVYGVIRHNEDKAFPGYNHFINEHDKAYLLDMDGNIVHTWYLPYKGFWEYSVVKKNGNLLAECLDKGIVELDWHSRVIMSRKMAAHHDLEVLSNSSYFVMDRIITEYKSRDVMFDTIKLFSKDGKVIDEWSTWENLEYLQTFYTHYSVDKDLEKPVKEIKKTKPVDYFHANTIKILPFTWLGLFDRRFQQGNWLVCLRNVSLIIILDKDTKKVVWHWGPDELQWPHMPLMLDNGDILIFDNGVGRKYSRIVQIDPRTYKITWEYKADPPKIFYSRFCGNAQRFPNGNTLIANADNGIAFEVTLQGEIVWEFYNFEIVNKQRRAFYRFSRYPVKMIDGLLKKYKDTEIISVPIKNNGFEDRDSFNEKIPLHWKYESFNPEHDVFIWDNSIVRTGKRSVKIVLNEKNDAKWFQYVTVQPQTRYTLSGWVKTENIPYNPENKDAGAHLAVTIDKTLWPIKSKSLTGNNDWTLLSCEFHSQEYSRMKIQCRLGFIRATATGTAWFDDMTLKKN